MWLGTEQGLFRFDGVHFERYEQSSGDKLSDRPLRSLFAAPDGSLWISYRLENKICGLRNGNVKCYGEPDGVVSNPTTIVQDHEGTLWANTESGVIRFNGTRWEHVGKEWNFPEDVPHENSIVLFVDSHGTLWSGVNHTVLYLKQGSKRFEPTGTFAGWSVSIAEAPDGTIWLADNFSYIRAISTSVSEESAAVAECEVETREGKHRNCDGESPLVLEIQGPDRLLIDRHGSLWITSDTSGVFRVPHPELLKDRPVSKTMDAVQRFTSNDGLSADDCNPILEDHEGNIWVGTRDGLDQFRDTALVPVALPTSVFHPAIAPADNGDIWVAASWKYVARIHAESSNVSLVAADAFKPYRDPAGVTWLMGNSLGQWKDGTFRTVAQSPDGRLGSFGTWQIAGDRSGTLWAFSSGLGFFSLDHRRWKAWPTPPKVAKQHIANMYSDSAGRIWVSTYEGDVITMDRGIVVDYPRKPDSPVRFVKAFAEHAPQEIWAGGEGGLVLIDVDHFRIVRPEDFDSFEDVTGIVDAGSEGLWLNTSGGVLHAPRDVVERALQDPSYRLHWEERFDSSDGLLGLAEDVFTFPKAVQGTDGRIWFTATRGVAWVDPKKRKNLRNMLPPPVSITSVFAAGSTHLQLTDLRFPAHTANVQISYTALSLSVPERVRFKYKLEGSDKDWQDVGTRREAFYTNLGPSQYRFRVMACNQDGVWNNLGAVVEFTIAPAWYQTIWFRLCCVAAFLLLLWAAYLLRIRQLRSQFAAGLEARVDERTRIARDLHDTLLQSFHGLMLHFQVVSRLLPEGKAKEELEKTLERADVAIAEGRSAVYDLRSSSVTATNDLAEALNAVADELSSDNAAAFNLMVEGQTRELQPIIRDEIYRLSREALNNAFGHAHARHIEVEISYGPQAFRLRIRDDGEGIPAEVLEHGRPGHFGVPGMRERARQIGAELTIWSRPDTGTEIDLSLAGTIAFGTLPGLSRFRLFRQKDV